MAEVYRNQEHTHPAADIVAVAPSDVSTFKATRAVIPDADGDLAVVSAGGQTAIIPVLGGAVYPISVVQILATGTDAGITSVVLLR